MGLLSLLVFIPLFGALLLIFIGSENADRVRKTSLAVSLAVLVVSLAILRQFNPALPGFQLVEKSLWIPGINAYYHLGIDGISLLLVLLTALLNPVCILASWTSVSKSVKGYHIALLLLESAVLGVFLSLDGLLFYIFWEAMLIPMSLMIGIWGSRNRVYAAVKFFLYTMAGGIFLLLALIVLYFTHYQQTGTLSLYIPDLYNLAGIPSPKLIFIALSLGFAIKVPLWPVHTWLPDAHTEAPTAGSVILAGVLLKMGVYGFLRFTIPIFPSESLYFSPWIIGLAIIGIIFGGLVAMVQTDVKRLVAYSSVSHMGFVVMGIFSGSLQGLTGGVIQMIIHGVNTGLLFLLIGMIYERRHTREMDAFGGLGISMPRFSTIFVIAVLASAALPGTNGFVGEFLCVIGGFSFNPLAGFLAALGVIVAAMYLLLVNQKVIFGKVSGENAALRDLSVREWITVLPLVALIFWMGLYPHPFLHLVESTLKTYWQTFLR